MSFYQSRETSTRPSYFDAANGAAGDSEPGSANSPPPPPPPPNASKQLHQPQLSPSEEVASNSLTNCSNGHTATRSNTSGNNSKCNTNSSCNVSNPAAPHVIANDKAQDTAALLQLHVQLSQHLQRGQHFLSDADIIRALKKLAMNSNTGADLPPPSPGSRKGDEQQLRQQQQSQASVVGSVTGGDLYHAQQQTRGTVAGNTITSPTGSQPILHCTRSSSRTISTNCNKSNNGAVRHPTPSTNNSTCLNRDGRSSTPNNNAGFLGSSEHFQQQQQQPFSPAVQQTQGMVSNTSLSGGVHKQQQRGESTSWRCKQCNRLNLGGLPARCCCCGKVQQLHAYHNESQSVHQQEYYHSGNGRRSHHSLKLHAHQQQHQNLQLQQLQRDMLFAAVTAAAAAAERRVDDTKKSRRAAAAEHQHYRHGSQAAHRPPLYFAQNTRDHNNSPSSTHGRGPDTLDGSSEAVGDSELCCERSNGHFLSDDLLHQQQQQLTSQLGTGSLLPDSSRGYEETEPNTAAAAAAAAAATLFPGLLRSLENSPAVCAAAAALAKGLPLSENAQNRNGQQQHQGASRGCDSSRCSVGSSSAPHTPILRLDSDFHNVGSADSRSAAGSILGSLQPAASTISAEAICSSRTSTRNSSKAAGNNSSIAELLRIDCSDNCNRGSRSLDPSLSDTARAGVGSVAGTGSLEKTSLNKSLRAGRLLGSAGGSGGGNAGIRNGTSHTVAAGAVTGGNRTMAGGAGKTHSSPAGGGCGTMAFSTTATSLLHDSGTPYGAATTTPGMDLTMFQELASGHQSTLFGDDITPGGESLNLIGDCRSPTGATPSSLLSSDESNTSRDAPPTSANSGLDYSSSIDVSQRRVVGPHGSHSGRAGENPETALLPGESPLSCGTGGNNGNDNSGGVSVISGGQAVGNVIRAPGVVGQNIAVGVNTGSVAANERQAFSRSQHHFANEDCSGGRGGELQQGGSCLNQQQQPRESQFAASTTQPQHQQLYSSTAGQIGCESSSVTVSSGDAGSTQPFNQTSLLQHLQALQNHQLLLPAIQRNTLDGLQYSKNGNVRFDRPSLPVPAAAGIHATEPGAADEESPLGPICNGGIAGGPHSPPDGVDFDAASLEALLPSFLSPLQILLLKAKDVADKLVQDFTLLGYGDPTSKAAEALRTSLAILGYAATPSAESISNSPEDELKALLRGNSTDNSCSSIRFSNFNGSASNRAKAGEAAGGRGGAHSGCSGGGEAEEECKKPKNANWAQGVGGPHFSAPTMLAHPDEFKNPSSFLKIYGDPMCAVAESASLDAAAPVGGRGGSALKSGPGGRGGAGLSFGRAADSSGTNSAHIQESGKGGLAGGSSTSIGGSSLPVRGHNGNWVCESCANVNFPRRFRCNKCGALRGPQGDAIVAEYAKLVYHQHLKTYRSLASRPGMDLPLKRLQVNAGGGSAAAGSGANGAAASIGKPSARMVASSGNGGGHKNMGSGYCSASSSGGGSTTTNSVSGSNPSTPSETSNCAILQVATAAAGSAPGMKTTAQGSSVVSVLNTESTAAATGAHASHQQQTFSKRDYTRECSAANVAQEMPAGNSGGQRLAVNSGANSAGYCFSSSMLPRNTVPQPPLDAKGTNTRATANTVFSNMNMSKYREEKPSQAGLSPAGRGKLSRAGGVVALSYNKRGGGSAINSHGRQSSAERQRHPAYLAASSISLRSTGCGPAASLPGGTRRGRIIPSSSNTTKGAGRVQIAVSNDSAINGDNPVSACESKESTLTAADVESESAANTMYDAVQKAPAIAICLKELDTPACVPGKTVEPSSDGINSAVREGRNSSGEQGSSIAAQTATHCVLSSCLKNASLSAADSAVASAPVPTSTATVTVPSVPSSCS